MLNLVKLPATLQLEDGTSPWVDSLLDACSQSYCSSSSAECDIGYSAVLDSLYTILQQLALPHDSQIPWE